MICVYINHNKIENYEPKKNIFLYLKAITKVMEYLNPNGKKPLTLLLDKLSPLFSFYY